MVKRQSTVVGVFLEGAHAQGALGRLKAAGMNASIADADRLDDSGLDDETIELYRSRMAGGAVLVIAQAGSKGDAALCTMLDSGAEYINLDGADTPHTAGDNGEAERARGERINRTQSEQNGPGPQVASDYRDLDPAKRHYGRPDATTGRGKSAETIREQLNDKSV
ncbi:MAG: hypothetical protein M3014_06865 [Chloroflexota bacterium]|nr:hypothetical protein [Chloroflexota bacterium]